MENKSKARFTNIKSAIEQLIQNSQSSIKIAVAWFTNKELLGLLKDKVKEGVKVEIIVSDDVLAKQLVCGMPPGVTEIVACVRRAYYSAARLLP